MCWQVPNVPSTPEHLVLAALMSFLPFYCVLALAGLVYQLGSGDFWAHTGFVWMVLHGKLQGRWSSWHSLPKEIWMVMDEEGPCRNHIGVVFFV